jgi:hypothetical protein
MKCRICASECPPGAKLCRDCAAARKRAFAATVTQPLFAAAGVPSVGRPRFAPRPARPRTASKAAAAAGRSEAAMAASAADGQSAAKKPLGVQWLLLALAIASAAMYLLIRIFFAPHAQPAGDANAPAESPSDLSAPAAASGAPVAVPPLPVAAAGGGIAGAQGAAEGEPAATLKEAGPKAPRHKVASRLEVPVVAPTPAPPPPPEPAPAPRSVPPPVVAAPSDPWQAMNEGLSRCGREDWLSRAACEQRLRLQYCPDHWGVVWQCPIGPATDHGQ